MFFAFAFIASNAMSQVKIPELSKVKEITQKVADWQIATFDSMGVYRALPAMAERKPWNNRRRYHDLEWECGALYAGMYEWSTIANDTKYVNWLIEIGNRNNWKLHTRMYHADDHAVGQFYLNLNQLYDKALMMQPTKAQFDLMLESEKSKELQWTWCDALFMAPPVWTRLAKVTNSNKYLDYMNTQYHMTYDLLWDKEEQLFFRDKSYLNQKEKNGKKLFWARGNGWVYGGLAFMIPDFPEKWNETPFYVELFKQMSSTLKKIQRPDGTWSSGLLGDVQDYPTVESSGTAFYVFGLAWGINNGILDKAVYEPVLMKGWNALVKCVDKKGMLGYVQGVGAAPGVSYKDYTEVYGAGAFLAAGTEMYKYIQKFYPVKNKHSKSTATLFMKDGGWCWYQDPRALISNGKLVMAGLSGVSGDVRLGVFDLKNSKIDGDVVLHKDFEIDDHDVPALYVRPDNSILAVWAKHAKEKVHYYNISSTTDYLKWGERNEFRHDYDFKTGVTYMNLYYMKDEGKLYNFFRDGLNFNPTYMTSTDFGETWRGRTHFISNDVSGRQRPYARYLQKDENTVAVSYTDGHPRDFGNSLYYVEFKGGAFYRADGTKIKSLSEGPLRTSEAEKVYVGSETKNKPKNCESVPNSAWTCAMAKDAKNQPIIGYTLYINNNDHRFRIAQWDGKKWNDREIAYAGKCFYQVESSYTGLMTFDPENPTQVYISTDVNPTTGKFTGGVHEIYSATIKPTDNIKTIRWKAITTGSTERNIRPILVAKDGYKVLVWLRGEWNSYVNYNVDVVGEVLKRP